MGRNNTTIVRTYTSPGAYTKDARRMERQGYRVVNTVNQAPRAGCLRILTLGIFTMIFPPKPLIVVTYRRQG